MRKESDILLEVENLKTYFFTKKSTFKAVDGVSFSLRKGETLGVVGESGCGKSVTALSIMRLISYPPGKIVGGRILFEGEDLLRKSDAEMRHIRGAKIGMILQDPLTSLNPCLRIGFQVGESIKLHQKIRLRELVKIKTVEVLSAVRIPDAQKKINDFPHQLSGGMRQRVTGAIVLSCNPLLIIADEPTTSLDVTIQAQFLELLKDVMDRLNTSMIFITHDFGIVAAVCDCVAVMYAGRIIETTTTSELFKYPLHPYTKNLIACLPKVDEKREILNTIEGYPPELDNLPVGCRFAARCNIAKERCYKEYPPIFEFGKGHIVHCWYAG